MKEASHPPRIPHPPGEATGARMDMAVSDTAAVAEALPPAEKHVRSAARETEAADIAGQDAPKQAERAPLESRPPDLAARRRTAQVSAAEVSKEIPGAAAIPADAAVSVGETVKTPKSEAPKAPLPYDTPASQLAQGIKSAIQLKKTQLTLKLRPEGLGLVTVDMTCKGSELSLTIKAERPDTRQLLLGQRQGLCDELVASRYKIKEMQVDTAPHMAANGGGFDFSRGSGREGSLYSCGDHANGTYHTEHEAENEANLPFLAARLNYRI